VMKKLGLAVVPLDLHTRPIGSEDRALIGRAVMPRDAVADFQLFGLFACQAEPSTSAAKTATRRQLTAIGSDIGCPNATRGT